MGKCRGLRTARKLRSHRRDQKWHDKQYKKAHLGTALKANPFGGASHAKGIVLEKPENAELLQSLRKQGKPPASSATITAHQRVGNKTPTGRTRKGGDPKGGAGAEAGLAP
ncbi:hypothetical protein R6Z07M_004052 [Ovis aries]